jgi:excisionase family DNA binding protein
MNERISSLTAQSSPWLNIGESAAYARTGKRIVYQAIRAGDLRHTRVGGRNEIRIKADWIDRWLEAGSAQSRG